MNKLIENFIAVTSSDEQTARHYLNMTQGAMDEAVMLYFDSNQTAASPSTSSLAANGSNSCSDNQVVNARNGGGAAQSGCPHDDDAEIRAPIPQRMETLVEEHYSHAHTSAASGRRKRRLSPSSSASVFNMDPMAPSTDAASHTSHLSSNQHHHKNSPNKNNHNQHQNTARETTSSSSTTSSSPAFATANSAGNKSHLNDLFAPPTHLTFKGSFHDLKWVGAQQNRWLLISVHNNDQFQCHAMNRDVWKDSDVITLVSRHFVFWQVLSSSPLAAPLTRYYGYHEDAPHLLILHPSSGEARLSLQPPSFSAQQVRDILRDFLRQNDFKPIKAGAAQQQNSTLQSHSSSSQQYQQSQSSQKEEREDEELREYEFSFEDEEEYENGEDGGEEEDVPAVHSEMKRIKLSAPDSEDEMKVTENATSSSQSFSVSKSTKTKNNSTTSKTTSRGDVISISGGGNRSSSEAEQVEGDESNNDATQPVRITLRFPDNSREVLEIRPTRSIRHLARLLEKRGYSRADHELVRPYPPRLKLSLSSSKKEGGGERRRTLQSCGVVHLDTLHVQQIFE